MKLLNVTANWKHEAFECNLINTFSLEVFKLFLNLMPFSGRKQFPSQKLHVSNLRFPLQLLGHYAQPCSSPSNSYFFLLWKR